MNDVYCMPGNTVTEEPSVVSSAMSWASDASMTMITSTGTSELDGSEPFETDSAREMVSLRSINARLALEMVRAEFWELLAKRALGEMRVEGTSARAVVVTNDGVLGKDTQATTLNDMALQMSELGSSMDALKVRASQAQATIDTLKEEVKRTDRLKNGYKRQVAELTAMLESKASHVPSLKEDAVSLQRKIAEMRVQAEGLKRERDSAQARADVAQGRHDELQERYARREQALISAQKRCRDLEDALAVGPKDGDEQDPRRGQEVTGVPRMDVGTCMVDFPNELLAIENDEHDDDDDDDDDDDEHGVVENVEAYHDGNQTIVGENLETINSNGDAESINDDSNPSEAHVLPQCQNLITISSPAYRRIFGDMTDLDTAAHVLVSAEDALAQCGIKIQQLAADLDLSRDESDQLKSQCAEQYHRVFKYKTMCTSLAAKVQALEAHIATTKQSTRDYQDQMDHLIQRQRAAAAEESHKLGSEIQFMSQEQARLLLKLHAVQLDLDKSRALSAEMARRCEALEGQIRGMRGERMGGIVGIAGGVHSGSTPSEDHVRSKLEAIAAGLKTLGGDPG